jgi:hypothetical protein
MRPPRSEDLKMSQSARRAVAGSERAFTELPLCRSCRSAGRLRAWFGALVVCVPGFAFLAVALALGAISPSPLPMLLGGVLVSAYMYGASFAIRTWWIKPRTVWTRHVDASTVTLSNVHPLAIQAAIAKAAAAQATGREAA